VWVCMGVYGCVYIGGFNRCVPCRESGLIGFCRIERVGLMGVYGCVWVFMGVYGCVWV
jgi:hypothetical protein